ncbi:hypothetical protein [Streptomyces erythrochromogenes]|uniref:hypothetical protein n=1 Tax=Streptomyces erythrochromogenes TaxID=285574 RepID=UPI003868EAAA|nr:hypothetical protein OG489_31935 [Streptomyces erythrochromogenes]
MNGNLAHALALAAATLLLLPFAIALLVGWTPSRLGTREVSRPYAYAILCLYLQAPLNTLPRMVDAPLGVVTAGVAVGVACGGAAVAFLVLALRAARRLVPEGER